MNETPAGRVLHLVHADSGGASAGGPVAAPLEYRKRLRQILNALEIAQQDDDDLGSSLADDIVAFRVDPDGTIEIDTVDRERVRLRPLPAPVPVAAEHQAEYLQLRKEWHAASKALRELLQLHVRAGALVPGALYLPRGEFFEEATCPQ